MKQLGSVVRRLGAGGLLLSLPLAGHALSFDVGGVSATLDTTLSVGASMRTEDPDSALIGLANGGSSRSVNDDDGNLNYEAGDMVSAAIKATHDLDLRYGDSGIFARTTYFYDAQADSDRRYFGRRGRDRLVSEIAMLDLFFYSNFRINNRPGSIRIGNQVVNWGESTFIQNGINAANPVDVAKLRTPGSELKEALLPLPMIWGSTSVTNNLSVEAMWIWNFREVEIDPRGSFFSTNDFLSDDGDAAYTGFGRRNDQHGADPATPPAFTTLAVGVPRTSAQGRPESETQQYGFALRYFAEWLNQTEFGLFYSKYHSRVPLVSVNRATDQTSTLTRVATSQFYADYPENIELYGISFNTGAPLGIALQGEYSYRPNLPVQLAATEVLLAALRLPNTIDAAEGTNSATADTQFDGFRRTAAHQVQMTATKAFGPTLGSSQFVVLGEAAVNKLELDKDLLFNGPGAGLPSCGNPGGAAVLAALSNGSCQEQVGGGYADRTSWGYRLVSRMDFENAIGAASLSPRLVFAHDVNGVGPNFNQDAKAVTVGLGLNYLQRWQADLSYTTFFDGRSYSGTDPIPPGAQIAPTTFVAGSANQSQSFETSANPNEDRDFVSINLSYAF